MVHATAVITTFDVSFITFIAVSISIVVALCHQMSYVCAVILAVLGILLCAIILWVSFNTFLA